MLNDLPPENLKSLSIHDLVHYGVGADSPPTAPARSAITTQKESRRREYVSVQVQTVQSGQTESQNFSPQNSPRNLSRSSRRSRQGRPSPYSVKALHAPKPVDSQMQTDDEMFRDYVRSKSTTISVNVANSHIEKAVGEEMTKTIASLNDFVNKVNLSSKINESKPAKKDQNKATQGSFFDTNRKSMAT